MLNKYLTYILIFCYSITLGQSTKLDLKADWKFRKKGTFNLYSASVPGTVHTDLLNNQLIKDPFYADNEKDLKWIENEDWEYIGIFNCDESLLKNKHIELNFEGLDTYAKVFLNGKQILDCNNMFRFWNIDVKNHLHLGENTLQIIFESSVKKGKEEAAKLSYILPGDEKVFTRKAQYQFGWDFGPRFVTCGIYKPVSLIIWNDFKIESTHHIIKKLNNSIAKIQFITEINSEKDTVYTIGINSFCSINTDTNLSMQKISMRLHKGINKDTFNYFINKPKLWYCSGLGNPTIYDVNFSVINKNKVLKINQFKIGLRTLELVRDKDSIGESFYFKLNGTPVFMKGANYIPQDNFTTRVDFLKVKKLIEMAKESNMNMIRVWGGGIYPDDTFFDLCDKNGILVWQDFMFACAMYPGDSAFLDNVKQEVTQQIKRLRNHPSLALWCGNNEVDEGWKNWGWQKQFKYSISDSTKIWNDYQKIFHTIIPNLIKELHPVSIVGSAPYHSSSPLIGWGHKESLTQGDSHYWGVWWGMEPFELYQKKVGRFMSEYGFQGMPEINTLVTVSDSSALTLNSVSVNSHQKHPKGFETIQTYMNRTYTIPTDFKKYNYASQLLQRDGLKIAIEAHRRSMPYCMGTLYWQLNDCWPVTSWSSIDYNYKPKAAYYEVKNLFNHIIISVNKVDSSFNINVISDKIIDINAELIMNVKNFSGKVLLQKTVTVKIKKTSSSPYYVIKEDDLKNFDKKEIYLSCELKNKQGEIVTKNIFCFVKPKELKLTEPDLKIEISESKSSLFITSKNYVKDLYLYFDNSGIELNTNFIDIEPNKTIEVKANLGLKFSSKFHHFSVYDLNN